jgi:hypothetical protein
MKKRVVILSTQDGDWEGLYIDGQLIDEGHTLGQGHSKTYLLRMSEEYKFTSKDIIYAELIHEDNDEANDDGCFKKSLSEFKGVYDVVKEIDDNYE